MTTSNALGALIPSTPEEAELLRNLAERSPWLERPELGEIKEIGLSAPAGRSGSEARKAYEFSLNALIKRPAAPDAAKPAAPRTSADEPIKLGAAR